MQIEKLGLQSNRVLPHTGRVMENAFLTDVYGNVLGITDLSFADITKMFEELREEDVVLLFNQITASELGLNPGQTTEQEATEDQIKALKSIARTWPKSLSIFNIGPQNTLPGLFVADLAVAASGIYFRNGADDPTIKLKFEEKLQELEEKPQLHIESLETAAFAKKIAQIALGLSVKI